MIRELTIGKELACRHCWPSSLVCLLAAIAETLTRMSWKPSSGQQPWQESHGTESTCSEALLNSKEGNFGALLL